MRNTNLNTRIKQSCFGKAKDVLTIEHIPMSHLREDKIRVRIEATNINPSDLLSIQGVGQYRYSHQPPRIPGFEAVGIVVDSKHADFIIGQKVVVAACGTWQRYIDVSSDNLFSIPNHLDNSYACQLYINALTAWILTVEIAQITKNDVLIINAASSAIGKIFAQLSLSLGFTLIAVTSRPEIYPYDSIYVVDTKQDLLAQLQQLNCPKPTIAFDAIGGDAGPKLLYVLDTNSRFINYGTLSLQPYKPFFFIHTRQNNIDFSTFFLRYWENQVGTNIRRNKFMTMLRHFITHKIHLDVNKLMPLEQAQSAIEIIETQSGTLNGKIILTPK